MKVPRKNREPFSFNYRFSTKVAILNDENFTSTSRVFILFFLSCRSLEKEEIKMWEYSLWCFVLEFLYVAFSEISLFCQWPRRFHRSEMLNLCGYCLFEKDIYIFNLNFEIELDLANVFEIYQYFGVFFNILSYWRSANKKLLDDIFDFDFDWEHNGLFGWFMDVCTKIWKLSAEHRNCLPRL